MKRFVIMVALAVLSTGCAAQRLMYAGPIKLKSEVSMGLMLESPNSGPVECLLERGGSFADLKDGQWVIVQGAPSRGGDLVLRLSECRVVAALADDGASGPRLGECRRLPSAPPDAAAVPPEE